MNNECIVSVIITCYNLQKYIARAINSCLNQTLHDSLYEIIIVDDCSTDDSWDIISNYLVEEQDIRHSNPRRQIVRGIRHDNNKGVSAASNTAINNAQVGMWFVSMVMTILIKIFVFDDTSFGLE